jgi:hypothetical protein
MELPRKKELILLAAGAIALAFFYILPPNKTWIQGTVLDYWKDFSWQHTRLSPEQRKLSRYGNDYRYSKEIAGFFAQKGINSRVLVLVPAPRYFKHYHFPYDTPEPAVFYYYTGLKTVRPADANAAQANWYVHLKKGILVMDSVPNRAAFADTIQTFKKMDAGL